MKEDALISKLKKITAQHDVAACVMARIANIDPGVYSRILSGDRPANAAERSRLESAIEFVSTTAQSVEPVPVNFRRWRMIAPLVEQHQKGKLTPSSAAAA